jgi:methylase of polypeptide subunit release factors
MRPATAVLRWPFRRRALAERWLGLRLPPAAPEDHYFDLVTPTLVGCAVARAGPASTVLDLGCGPFAVVGQAVARRTGARVICADVDPALVARAREAVALGGADVEVRESRFFDGVADERFDLVCFNPPYVPVGLGERLELPEARRSQWAAGEEGLEVVSGFLAALSALPQPVTALLAVNRWFVPEGRVRESVGAHVRLVHAGCERARLLPADVHRIEHPGTGRAPSPGR